MKNEDLPLCLLTTAAPLLTPPVIVADQNVAAGTNVMIALTNAKDDNSNPLQAPLAGSENLIAVVSGVVAKIVHSAVALADGPATSTIDVEAAIPRTAFVDKAGIIVDPPGAGDDTDATHSQAGLSMTNASEFGLDLIAADLIDVTVKRDVVAGVTGAIFSGNAMVAGFNEWTDSTVFGGGDDPVAAPRQILLTADGAAIVLRTGTWTFDFVATMTQSGNEPRALGAMSLLTDENSHIWGINGWQAVYPF